MQTSDETPAQEQSLGGGDRWRWVIPLCLAALLAVLMLLWLRAQPLSSRVVDLPTPSPDLLFPPHPAWIRRHNDTREEKYVTSLARALEWGFRDRPRSGR